MMTITARATKTIGIGCIEGDTRVYKNVSAVNDMGTYYEVVIHENRSIRFVKEAWIITTAKR